MARIRAEREKSAATKSTTAILTIGEALAGPEQFALRSRQIRDAAPWITVAPHFTHNLGISSDRYPNQAQSQRHSPEIMNPFTKQAVPLDYPLDGLCTRVKLTPDTL